MFAMYDRRLTRTPSSLAILSLSISLLTACAGNIITALPAAPVFTSTPVTQAVEGSPYSYQPTASGTAVTFSLTNAPTGPTFSGNTISWTPTAQQSRVPNSFTVTATASGRTSATQSWTVIPAGTIRITWVDTLWDETGSRTTRTFNWGPVSSYVAALVPQQDGSFQTFNGTVGANGDFEIPNVPGGYFWLRLAPHGIYWTSSSTFDMGADLFVVPNNTVATSSTTFINLSFTSLDPTPTSGLLGFHTFDAPVPHDLASTNAGSSTFFEGLVIGSNLDFSAIKNAFVTQYEPTAFGSVNGYVLGPELTLSNLSLTTGGQNTISGALNPAVPASIHLSVQSSAWIPLLDHIAPTTPTAIGDGFSLSVQPYIPADGPNLSTSDPIELIWTNPNLPLGLTPVNCSFNTSLTTDVDAAVQYSDPFPPAWRRTFRVCESASIAVPVPGTGQTQKISLTNNQTTVPPTATVKPLLSAVQNPKINGADLFTPATVSSTAVTLSWDPPAIGTPFGYQVSIMTPATSPSPSGAVSYVLAAVLGTAKTSIPIPPGVLASGRTYLFVITALADGKANMETSPHRSSLPTANADLLSAPITTN